MPEQLLRLHVWHKQLQRLLAAYGLGSARALNSVVHYVYDGRNAANGDPANVFYIRSADSGVTFSAPFQLNTDTTIRPSGSPISRLPPMAAFWPSGMMNAKPLPPVSRVTPAFRATECGHATPPTAA